MREKEYVGFSKYLKNPKFAKYFSDSPTGSSMDHQKQTRKHTFYGSCQKW
jgi:hypothetical protein